MSKTPFFSVVVPTRNRANLLPFAIKSLLNQTFTDFEIIVSDNASSDNTFEVTKSFGDKRIRYVRSSESLSMNGSWKFALTHASADYITFLSDDDAFTVNALERVKSIIEEKKPELLYWKFAYYYLGNRHNADYPLGHPLRNIKSNTLAVPTFSSHLIELDADSIIESALLNPSQKIDSPFILMPRVPQFTNSVYHRTLFDNIKTQDIDIFREAVIPDIYAGAVAALNAKKCFYLDEPLTVFCLSEGSTTASSSIDIEKFAKQFGYSEQIRQNLLTPIKSFVNHNYDIQSILQAKEDCGMDSNVLNINRRNYFISYFENLMLYRKQGISITKELEEYNRILSTEDHKLQSEVHTAISLSAKKIIKKAIQNMPRSSFVNKIISRLSYNSIPHRRIVIKGAQVGFTNITECGAWLNKKRIQQLSEFSLGKFENQSQRLPFKWQIS